MKKGRRGKKVGQKKSVRKVRYSPSLSLSLSLWVVLPSRRTGPRHSPLGKRAVELEGSTTHAVGRGGGVRGVAQKIARPRLREGRRRGRKERRGGGGGGRGGRRVPGTPTLAHTKREQQKTILKKKGPKKSPSGSGQKNLAKKKVPKKSAKKSVKKVSQKKSVKKVSQKSQSKKVGQKSRSKKVSQKVSQKSRSKESVKRVGQKKSVEKVSQKSQSKKVSQKTGGSR